MNERPQARGTGVLAESVGEELVVYDSVTRSAHCLSADAARVWALCDGRRSPEEIARELGVAAEQVGRALRELGDAGLLESVAFAERRVSRRAAAKHLATIGAAAISAPLIYSVAIPRAAAAMSGGGGQTNLCAGVDCDDQNACTIDECDPNTGGCSHTPLVCNDNNPCTTDTCHPVTGCVFTPVVCPPSENPCAISYCDSRTGGCVLQNVANGTLCGETSYCEDGVCSPT